MTNQEYAVVALWNPKNPINVGSVLRAAGCFGAAAVVIGGKRRWPMRSAITNTMATQHKIPVTFADDLRAAIPHDCVPIAVDLVPGAKPLHTFPHPPRAFYVLGPEDGTLPASVVDWCRDAIYVPTSGCLNLAKCANIILYDRAVKRGQLPAGRYLGGES